jgi:hypothetical protein
MNESKLQPGDDLANVSREDIMSALFANMVIQQTNMAMMLLGKTPHPETGQFLHDVEAAKMFIDQLEMLEVKTKGNLNKQEEGLLKQALTALHMTFVSAMDEPASAKPAETTAAPTAPAPSITPESAPAAAAKPSPASSSEPAAAPDESRKKFSKKY